VHQHGRTGILVELAQAADMIDVRVSTDNGFDGKLVAAKEVEDAMDFVAGIHYERFTRDGVADDRAIALQHAHRNRDVDQSILRGAERGQAITHAAIIASESGGFAGDAARFCDTLC
jgi:hypothetical protein